MANPSTSTSSGRPSSIPIPITRPRAASVASSSSSAPDLSGSPSSSPPAPALKTPFPLSPTSPTLSKFLQTAPILSTSPTASRLAGYFGQTPGSAVETDDLDEFRQRASGRRMSTGWAGRPFPSATTAGSGAVQGPPAADQGTGLMRRFSLSGAFARVRSPTTSAYGSYANHSYVIQPFIPPPPTAPVTGPTAAANNSMPTIAEPTPVRAAVPAPSLSPPPKGRGRTLAPPKPKRRSVSPMSERILKGQFDGFV
ncbi:hypothetical protein CALVIDRAFT_530720 [Calocera viscosa TUFC12733]|uniref:Uncharacterized protein n=1 Tax=Calocera viscosa (strain TUFC12733) TaxID=1330018 RepID=A0A167HE90_CALVF|nr:hypothetical protein CALVIDRAFT_530720 [Calocera viscosa TUFC12733]